MSLWLLLIWTLGQGSEEAVQRGRLLYRTGTRPDGSAPIAKLGTPAVDVAASSLPCAGCHGNDGRGRTEGGVEPANITWTVLGRPLRTDQVPSRNRPAYTRALLKRAIVLGVDAGGNPLATTMPRYQLRLDDAEALLAYLQALEHERDPGIYPDRLVLAVLLGRASDPAQAERQAVINAYLAWSNRRGGIFGRQLEPHFLSLPEEPGSQSDRLTDFIDRVQPFALIAPDLAGMERLVGTVAAARALPLLATHAPELTGKERTQFRIQPGLAEQAQALFRRAAKPAQRAAIVASADRAELAQSLVDACAEQGWPSVPALHVLRAGQTGTNLAAQLAAKNYEPLFYLGLAAEEASFLAELARHRDRRPRLMTLAAFLTPALRDLPELEWASPLPLDQLDFPGSQKYRALAADAGLPTRPSQAQVEAIAVLELLLEAVIRSGFDLSRERMMAALESGQAFEVGCGQPLRFAPTRHVGSDKILRNPR